MPAAPAKGSLSMTKPRNGGVYAPDRASGSGF
jgi:hypothetical protein